MLHYIQRLNVVIAKLLYFYFRYKMLHHINTENNEFHLVVNSGVMAVDTGRAVVGNKKALWQLVSQGDNIFTIKNEEDGRFVEIRENAILLTVKAGNNSQLNLSDGISNSTIISNLNADPPITMVIKENQTTVGSQTGINGQKWNIIPQ